MVRRYYSQRNSDESNKLSLMQLKEIYIVIFNKFYQGKYFCENLDIGCCVDQDDANVSPIMIIKLRKDLWPLEDWYDREGKLEDCTQNELFDIIEFFYDRISEPVETENLYIHGWNGCGYHYEKYSMEAGQEKYRKEINEALCDYGEGYELSAGGEILHIPDDGVKKILEAKVPDNAKGNIKERIYQAQELFYRGRSSYANRRSAVKELADCFEFLKDDLNSVLNSKDEKDLFNIANNFGIRHYDKNQKTDYDQGIWLSWMFHYYLATLHAALRLIEKRTENERSGK